MKGFRDLREWLERSRQLGELAVVDGADTKYEMGTIAELCARNEGPAVLHRNIKGYAPDLGVLTNMFSNVKNINLTFGMPLDNSIRDTVVDLAGKIPEWESAARTFPPKIGEEGSILENVVEEQDVDLSIFPVPTWHELDGGPYIGTGHMVITADPDTGQVNAGSYRCQLLDRQHVAIMMSQGKHGRMHREKYFERGQPCPVVMAFGVDPLLFGISAAEISLRISEFNYAGAIRGEPIPMVRGRVTGLPIPANAEIAVEGFIDPTARRAEGPFGEWTGYYAGGRSEQPFIKVAALYYRNGAIITGAPPAKGVYSSFVLFRSLWRSALIHNALQAAGVPEVRGVWCPPVGGAHWLQVVSIKQRYGGHATQAGHAVLATRAGAFAGRYTIVVDDDIDPYDTDDVLWAVCSRSKPADSEVIKQAWSSHTDPTIRAGENSAFTSSRMIIYAVKPFEWRNEFAAVNLSSVEARKGAYAKWKDVFKGRWQTV